MSASGRSCAKAASSGASKAATSGHQSRRAARSDAPRFSVDASRCAISGQALRGTRSPQQQVEPANLLQPGKPTLACSLTSGCLSNASSATGAKRSAPACASDISNVPGGNCASGRPAESSAAMPQRARWAETRVRQSAVRRHQRRRPGSLDGLAQGNGDGLRFLGRIIRLDGDHATQANGPWPRGPAMFR